MKVSDMNYNQLKDFIIERWELTPSEKVDKMFYLAWEYGHSYGCNEVLSYVDDLVELIK